MERQEEIRQVVQRYSDSIFKLAYTYVKNKSDAEDIAQSVFLTYLQQQKQFHDETHERAWLIRVTINKCKDFLKSGWFRSRNPLPEQLGYMPEEHRGVIEAVWTLDIKFRVPIHMHYYEGYSLQEIATVLRLPVGTVGSRLARGRMRLKELLGGDEDVW
jgi:RNA polymerase sigma-70 factor (ECF subfamily)